MKVRVECYAGFRADERPVAVWIEGRRLAVTEVVDTWFGEDCLCFRLKLETGDRWLVRRDGDGDWSLVQFDGT